MPAGNGGAGCGANGFSCAAGRRRRRWSLRYRTRGKDENRNDYEKENIRSHVTYHFSFYGFSPNIVCIILISAR
jgi:hypothetical protein